MADSPIGTFFSTPFGSLCRSDRGDRPTSICTEMEGGRRLATGGSVEAAALVAEMHLLRLLPSLDFNVIFLVALLK